MVTTRRKETSPAPEEHQETTCDDTSQKAATKRKPCPWRTIGRRLQLVFPQSKKLLPEMRGTGLSHLNQEEYNHLVAGVFGTEGMPDGFTAPSVSNPDVDGYMADLFDQLRMPNADGHGGVCEGDGHNMPEYFDRKCGERRGGRGSRLDEKLMVKLGIYPVKYNLPLTKTGVANVNAEMSKKGEEEAMREMEKQHAKIEQELAATKPKVVKPQPKKCKAATRALDEPSSPSEIAKAAEAHLALGLRFAQDLMTSVQDPTPACFSGILRWKAPLLKAMKDLQWRADLVQQRLQSSKAESLEPATKQQLSHQQEEEEQQHEEDVEGQQQEGQGKGAEGSSAKKRRRTQRQPAAKRQQQQQPTAKRQSARLKAKQGTVCVAAPPEHKHQQAPVMPVVGPATTVGAVPPGHVGGCNPSLLPDPRGASNAQLASSPEEALLDDLFSPTSRLLGGEKSMGCNLAVDDGLGDDVMSGRLDPLYSS